MKELEAAAENGDEKAIKKLDKLKKQKELEL